MLDHRPHTHPCPYCGRDVECEAALSGGCLFDAKRSVTCEPCSKVAVRYRWSRDEDAVVHAIEGERVGDSAALCGADPTGPAFGLHRCEACTAEVRAAITRETEKETR